MAYFHHTVYSRIVPAYTNSNWFGHPQVWHPSLSPAPDGTVLHPDFQLLYRSISSTNPPVVHDPMLSGFTVSCIALLAASSYTTRSQWNFPKDCSLSPLPHIRCGLQPGSHCSTVSYHIERGSVYNGIDLSSLQWRISSCPLPPQRMLLLPDLTVLSFFPKLFAMLRLLPPAR